MAFKTQKSKFSPIEDGKATILYEVSEKATARHNECAFCKHSVTLPLGGGEYVRVCKKKIGCDDFTPADV